ncbi:MAG: lipocalin family protein [Flavobacteriales bacterium]|nr:lipocalin family protein [Flavobacteriales bacterium]
MAVTVGCNLKMTRIKHIIVLVGLTSLCSCYELQSDEDLHDDIVGTWKKVDCKWPIVDDEEITADALLMPRLSFSSNGTFNEFGLYAYCCSDNCDTSYQGSCTWTIQDGHLIIEPSSIPNGHEYLNRPYPIKVLKKNQLVFDNFSIDNFPFKKACYCRE